MKEAFLIAVLIILFVAGYFVMKKTDALINENTVNIENEAEKSAPSYILLTDELTDEEIIDEIKQFKKTHGKSDVYICCNDSAGQNEENSSENK